MELRRLAAGRAAGQGESMGQRVLEAAVLVQLEPLLLHAQALVVLVAWL